MNSPLKDIILEENMFIWNGGDGSGWFAPPKGTHVSDEFIASLQIDSRYGKTSENGWKKNGTTKVGIKKSFNFEGKTFYRGDTTLEAVNALKTGGFEPSDNNVLGPNITMSNKRDVAKKYGKYVSVLSISPKAKIVTEKQIQNIKDQIQKMGTAVKLSSPEGQKLVKLYNMKDYQLAAVLGYDGISKQWQGQSYIRGSKEISVWNLNMLVMSPVTEHHYNGKLNNLFELWNSYPGHPGRPGFRGGSLPRGAGSAHIMSESEIIDKAWRTDKDASSDPGFRKFALSVAEAQGFTGKPQKMSNDDFQKIDDEKYEIFHRGIRDTEEMSADQIHKEFMDGEYYVSGNLYDTIGKGIYMTDDYDYAKSYADQNKLLGVKGVVESIAIPRSAKVLDLRTSEGLTEASKAFDEVNKLNTKISDKYKTDLFTPSDENTKRAYTLTVWDYLETKGYDGIRNDAELCLFNRAIAVVNEQVEK